MMATSSSFSSPWPSLPYRAGTPFLSTKDIMTLGRMRTDYCDTAAGDGGYGLKMKSLKTGSTIGDDDDDDDDGGGGSSSIPHHVFRVTH